MVYAGFLLGVLTPLVGAQNQINLSLMTWNVGYKITFDRAGELFTKKYPNVKLSVEASDWGSYWQKLGTRLAGGMPPNMTVHHQGVLRRYAREGLLVELTDWFNRDIGWESFQEKYWTGSFIECRYPNKFDPKEDIYAIPWSQIGWGIYYNKTLFDQAGVEYPFWYTTWDSFLTAAKKLTQPPDQWGLDSSRIDIHFAAAIVETYGGSFLDPTNTQCTLDSPEAIEALQFVVDLVDKYDVAPVPTYAPGADLFMTGKYGMTITGSWMGPAFKEITRFEWDIAPLPKGKVRTGEDPAAAPLVIFEGTEHQDISWEFIKFTLTPEVQRIVAEEGNDPILKEVTFSKSYLDPEIWPQGRMTFYWQLPWATHTKYHEWFFEGNEIFMQRWKAVMAGEKPLVPMVKEIVKETNELLKDAVPAAPVG